MSDSDVIDGPTGVDGLGLVRDFTEKLLNGTIPFDDAACYLKGEATKGSQFWFHDAPVGTIEIENWRQYTSFEHQMQGAEVVELGGPVFKPRLELPICDTVRSGKLELLPIRRPAKDREILSRALSDPVVDTSKRQTHERAVISAADFFTALVDRQKLSDKSNLTVVGYVNYGEKNYLGVLEARWGMHGGIEGWKVTSYDFVDAMKHGQMRRKGSLIVRRAFWS